MIVGVPRETFPGERRVALVPTLIPSLTKAGIQVRLESGAGAEAGFPDQQYADKGVQIVGSRQEVFGADVVLQVRAIGANPEQGRADLELVRWGQSLIAFCDPLSEPKLVAEFGERGASAFSLELIPRITRAQSMDALSSMATVAGYKAVLLAAVTLPKMFPLLITAAGTITPAKVFVVGAGVAGLQAIATARRLGAVVSAYDVRPAVKQEVESLGATFLELALETEEAQDKGGYARAFDEEFYRRQREMMLDVLATSDIVVTTAAVPGKTAPTLVTAEMVAAMQPGSVIVDLAAERGGNCELTVPGKTVVEHGVSILGPDNLPSTTPYHASQMLAKNIVTLLLHLSSEGSLQIDLEDEITRETLVTHGGTVVHAKVKQLLSETAAEPPEEK